VILKSFEIKYYYVKKLIGICAATVLLTFTGCFDTVQESTIKDDGSGVFVSSTDMGKLLGMLKMFMGEKEEMKELEKMVKDTTIYLKDIKDSVKNLTDPEKKLMDKGTLRILMNMPDEKFTLNFSFPFTQPSDLVTINGLLKKTKQDVMSDQLKKFKPGELGADPKDKDDENPLLGGLDTDGKSNEVDDYYTYKYEKGKISKKLNKEMHAKVEEDKSLTTMKEMSQMGMSSTMKTIINLPKPAKKAEGKRVKLSADRKKVTIEGTLDDFFEDASYFEYEIEY